MSRMSPESSPAQIIQGLVVTAPDSAALLRLPVHGKFALANSRFGKKVCHAGHTQLGRITHVYKKPALQTTLLECLSRILPVDSRSRDSGPSPPKGDEA